MDRPWTSDRPVTVVCVLGVVVKTGAVRPECLVTPPQMPRLEPGRIPLPGATDFGSSRSDPVTKLHGQPSLFLLLGNRIVNRVLGAGCDHC